MKNKKTKKKKKNEKRNPSNAIRFIANISDDGIRTKEGVQIKIDFVEFILKCV